MQDENDLIYSGQEALLSEASRHFNFFLWGNGTKLNYGMGKHILTLSPLRR